MVTIHSVDKPVNGLSRLGDARYALRLVRMGRRMRRGQTLQPRYCWNLPLAKQGTGPPVSMPGRLGAGGGGGENRTRVREAVLADLYERIPRFIFARVSPTGRMRPR